MFGFYLFKYALYSIIYLGIAVAGVLNQKYIETAFLFIAFIMLRYCFPKTFHSKSVYRCVFYSIMVFWIGIPHTLPITISIFSSIIIGLLITFILYKIEDYVMCKETIFKLTSKTIWQMDENELADYCYAKGIRGDMLEFVIMKVVYQMQLEEIGNKLGYALPTMKDWSKICKEKLDITSWKN